MKLYTSILAMLSTFFGMADASESELHQALAEAGTLDEIKDKAKADAQANFETKVNDLNEKITANAEAVGKLKAEVDTMFQDLTAARQALEAKDGELAASQKKVTDLSTELADLKVAKAATKQVEKADEGLKTETEKQTKKDQKVISNEAFMSMFN